MTIPSYRLYAGAIALVIVSPILHQLVTVVAAPAITQAEASIGILWTTIGWLSVVVATMSRLSATFGVWVTPAEYTWCDASQLVRHRMRQRHLVGAIGSVALGLLAAVSSNAAGLPWAIGLLATTTIALISHKAVCASQHVDRLVLPRLIEATGIATATGSLMRSHGLIPAVTTIGIGALIGCVVLRRPEQSRDVRWHKEPPRWQLSAAGAQVVAYRYSAAMLDPAALTAERQRHGASSRPPLRTHSRLLRFGARSLNGFHAATLVLWVLLTTGAGTVWGAGAAAVILVVGAGAVAAITTRALDAYVDSPALRRTYRGSRVVWPLATPAITACVLGTLAAAAIAGLTVQHALIATATALGLWLRRWSARENSASVGALVSTPMGGLPLGLVNRVAAGPDVLILACLLMVDATPSKAAGGMLLVAGCLALKRRLGHQRGQSRHALQHRDATVGQTAET